eukprot:COSAG01_NODE_741_length_13888_cov_119.430996_13_plen_181_part_00
MTAAADCLKGGTDINSGGTYKAEIAPGIASGVISLESARQALHNAYGFRMRLGLFDANATDKNRAIPIAAIGSAEHHQASLDAARSSLILLKNSLATGLPFQPGKKLVVVGSDVDSLAAIMEPGNYIYLCVKTKNVHCLAKCVNIGRCAPTSFKHVLMLAAAHKTIAFTCPEGGATVLFQ